MSDDLIPLIAVSLSLLFGTLIVLAMIILNYRKRVLAGKEIMAAIEKGIDVPLLVATQPKSYYTRGVLWTSIGIAVTLALWFSTYATEAAAWGLLPVSLGVAYLLIARREDQAGKET